MAEWTEKIVKYPETSKTSLYFVLKFYSLFDTFPDISNFSYDFEDYVKV